MTVCSAQGAVTADRRVVKTEEPEERGPKVTPIFVSEPTPRARRVPSQRDGLGRPTEPIESASEEAASHWDVRAWRP